jgi:DNA-binding NarL/FixJ family response regulator
MRVLIAEQRELLRAGFMAVIAAARPDWELAQAHSLTNARQCLQASDFTVMLIGVELFECGDPRELLSFRSCYPELKIIVCSADPDSDTILACFAVGAHGFFAGSAEADLLRAIHRVMSDPGATPAVAADPDLAPPARLHPGLAGGPAVHLTGRQSDVLNLLGKGRSTKEIARTLGLSVGTIKVHLASTYRVLGARNRVEAAVRAHAILQ